jgi:hypothetical protein
VLRHNKGLYEYRHVERSKTPGLLAYKARFFAIRITRNVPSTTHWDGL